VNKDEPVSSEALEYMDKMFECEKPCDSYGICDNCYEQSIFLAGYNFGYRAAKTPLCLKKPKELTPQERADRAYKDQQNMVALNAEICKIGACIHREHWKYDQNE
jgi:hypothetical protein